MCLDLHTSSNLSCDIRSRLNVQYPMAFKLTNKTTGQGTHCGVLEFVAAEGVAHMPNWMMESLLLEDGSPVMVRTQSSDSQNLSFKKIRNVLNDDLNFRYSDRWNLFPCRWPLMLNFNL